MGVFPILGKHFASHSQQPEASRPLTMSLDEPTPKTSADDQQKNPSNRPDPCHGDARQEPAA